MIHSQDNFRIQKWLTVLIVFLFLIKILAWYYTKSVAILTDTIEYIINVISGFIGLYSLYISAKPKDKNHPYGHGKIEFLSATIEGTLMMVSSLFIVYKAILNIQNPQEINKLDYGIYLIALTGVINYYAGHIALKYGKKNHSLALTATGKHMQSDTIATAGIIVGLIVIYFTKLYWIDSVVALIFAVIIILSGYRILRSSIAGIMDEADSDLLDQVVALCQSKRKENWVDIHNLRIIKYGATLHLDCHLTVPWYFNIHEGHDEVESLSKLVKDNFGDSLELFVHTDGCLDFSCKICSKDQCSVRIHSFQKSIVWNIENISTNSKHSLS